MSTSYGSPIELFSVDPNSGAQTELADISVTNLLAELPALEAVADGVNLGLQLADGTQIHFASTARLATFLYSVAVQQMQATSFVTDNYNLDMQWLNTVDQPLLDEGVYWNERAAAEASIYPERTVEDNAQASIALQIAAEDPANRQDMTVTIHNDATGNPTQITVFTGGGSSIHDVAPNVFQEVLSGISTVVSIAAVLSGNVYVYFAAAALDAAEAGEDFSESQILPGILSLAQAVAAGITAGAGGTSLTTPPPVAAQVINAAVQGVGGVYGVVQSAETGNALGILAGALEAAAAGATGIEIEEGGDTQKTLNAIATVLGRVGLATSVASDFASGNLGQGLIDSLNLYLPAVAQEYVKYLNNSGQVLQPLAMDAQAIAAASGDSLPEANIPDFGSIVADAMASDPSNSPGVAGSVTPVQTGGLANVGAAASTGGVGEVVTQNGTTYAVGGEPSSLGDGSKILASSGSNQDTLRFLAYKMIDGLVPSGSSARDMSSMPVAFVDKDGNQLLNEAGQAMMKPSNADPAMAPEFGAFLVSSGDESLQAEATAMVAAFRQAGAWDFQRVGTPWTIVSSFQDYANVEIGAYAAAIGTPLSSILQTANDYAAKNSDFGTAVFMDPTYSHLPGSKVWDITQGYKWYNSGLIGHH